jgi:mannosyltransferase OCH1-like enzyme
MNFFLKNNLPKKHVVVKKPELNNEQLNILKNNYIFNKKNIKFSLKEKYDSIIPLNLYTCWHTKELPPLMKKNYEITKELNPEFKHYLYDENECREFIKNNFDENVVNAYDSLIPSSYKSDLWRFCVLYTNGGIYFDIKYTCVNGFKFISLTEKEHFTKDAIQTGESTYTALLVMLPKNDIMLKCINQIVENVKNKYYGVSSLSPTGPFLLHQMITSGYKKNMVLYHEHLELSLSYKTFYIVFFDTIILKMYDEYRNEQQKYQKENHYNILWNNRSIYRITSPIPKIIFQTSKNRPQNYVIHMIKNLCPGWSYIHFTDDDIVNFFESNYLDEFPNIIEKFNSIKNGAHKADLFRYYFIYVNGGVFLDSDAMLQKNIHEIIKDYDFFSVNSIPCPDCIFQGFIGANAKNEIIYEALKDIYNINLTALDEDYHIICKNLFNILKKKWNYKIKIYTEIYGSNNVSLTIDNVYSNNNHNNLILAHYFGLKIVPPEYFKNQHLS